MNETKNMLTVVNGETLMDMKLPPTKFCVETLLPQGISILGGAPKSENPGWCLICASALQKAMQYGICLHKKAQRCTSVWKIH